MKKGGKHHQMSEIQLVTACFYSLGGSWERFRVIRRDSGTKRGHFAGFWSALQCPFPASVKPSAGTGFQCLASVSESVALRFSVLSGVSESVALRCPVSALRADLEHLTSVPVALCACWLEVVDLDSTAVLPTRTLACMHAQSVTTQTEQPQCRHT